MDAQSISASEANCLSRTYFPSNRTNLPSRGNHWKHCGVQPSSHFFGCARYFSEVLQDWSGTKALNSWTEEEVSYFFKTFKGGKFANQAKAFEGLDGDDIAKMTKEDFLRRSSDRGDLIFNAFQEQMKLEALASIRRLSKEELKSLEKKPLEEWTTEDVRSFLVSTKDGAFKEVAVNTWVDGKSLVARSSDEWSRLGGNESIGIEVFKTIQEMKKNQGVVKYEHPEPLLHTFGAGWEYQLSARNERTLKTEFPRHYQIWKEKQRDKNKNPMFHSFGGPGSGKSKLLQVFPHLCLSALPGSQAKEFRERFQKVLIFHVSFENGTAYGHQGEQKFGTAYSSIGLRMLYQVTPSPKPDFDEFRKDPKNFVDPGSVISRVAHSLRVQMDRLAVFLVVDGLHNLEKVSSISKQIDQSGVIKLAIDNLRSFMLSSSAFVTICTSMTVQMPAENALKGTGSHNPLLFPQPLNAFEILKDEQTKNPIVRMIAEDVGGHGRTLEYLAEMLEGFDLERGSFSNLVNALVQKIKAKYSFDEWPSERLAVLRAVFTRKKLAFSEMVPGTRWTVDELVRMGSLVRFKRTSTNGKEGVLECPFIQLIAFHNDLFADPVFFPYDDRANEMNPRRNSYRNESWENFELFCAKFRLFKSQLFQGRVTLGELHNGALFGARAAETKVISTPLKIVQCSDQTSSKSEHKSSPQLKCEDDFHDPDDLSLIFLNAPNAPHGDYFCNLQHSRDNTRLREVTQCKRWPRTILYESKFEEELEKSAVKGKDFFIAITTGPAKSFPLPPMTALVDFTTFEDYFGPFGKRAWRAVPPEVLDANLSPVAHLETVEGMGVTRVQQLIQERKKKAFSSLEDCQKRTKIPIEILKKLSYQSLEEKDDLNTPDLQNLKIEK